MGYIQMSVVIQEDTAPLFNYLFKVLAPVVYIVLLTAIFQKIGLDSFVEKIYWIVIDYWLIRFFAVILLGHFRLINWITQIVYWVSSIGLALWFQSIIDQAGSILPDPKSLLEELWVLIIVFLYSIFNKITISRSGSQRRKERYVERQFLKFKDKYSNIVSRCCNSTIIEAITYSIMIYENFNRPGTARFIERTMFCRSNKKHSFGIMQVCSDKVLTDEESIELGIDIIKKAYTKFCNDASEKSYLSLYDMIFDISIAYNGGDRYYREEVYEIFKQIIHKYYPELEDFTNEDLKRSIADMKHD